MPRTDLPRLTIGLTFSEDQLARIEELIAQFNATRQSAEPMRNYQQCIAGGLVALEALLFDMTGKTSVFEGLR
jgi:hypothetical protein